MHAETTLRRSSAPDAPAVQVLRRRSFGRLVRVEVAPATADVVTHDAPTPPAAPGVR